MEASRGKLHFTRTILCHGSTPNTMLDRRYSRYSKWVPTTGKVNGTLFSFIDISSRHEWFLLIRQDRVTLAFEKLTPLQCCARFERGVGRPVKYIHGPIKIAVSIPSGYREHLEILQDTLGHKRAPYFGPNLEYPREGRSIWEGHRGIEEYAREVFPIEEYNNGLRWMEETGTHTPSEPGGSVHGDGGHEGPGSRGSTRPTTPAGQPPLHVQSAYTPRSHPEAREQDFFVGSC